MLRKFRVCLGRLEPTRDIIHASTNGKERAEDGHECPCYSACVHTLVVHH